MGGFATLLIIDFEILSLVWIKIKFITLYYIFLSEFDIK